MTIVSHEREPGELGYVARYAKTVKELEQRGARRSRRVPRRPARRASRGRTSQAEMLRLHVCRRLSERLDGIEHGPGGSIDKLLMTWVEQTVGARRARRVGAAHASIDADDVALKVYLYSRAQSVMGGTSQIQKNIIAHAHPRPARRLSTSKEPMDYDLPDVIRVEADGPVRIVRLNRPEQLNAINDELHLGLTRAVPAARAPTPTRASRSSPATGARSRPAATSTSSTAWRRTATLRRRRDRRRPRARAQHDRGAGSRSSPRSTGRPSASAAA